MGSAAFGKHQIPRHELKLDTDLAFASKKQHPVFPTTRRDNPVYVAHVPYSGASPFLMGREGASQLHKVLNSSYTQCLPALLEHCLDRD